MAATASAAFASSFTATVTPASVLAGTTTTFNFTLTNTSQSTPLNSAVIKAPYSFTLTAASLGTQPGTVLVAPKKLTLTGLNLQPGATDTVAISASAPCPPDNGFLWSPTAYTQGVGSRQLDLAVPPSTLSTDVTGSCSLQFVTEPTTRSSTRALPAAPTTAPDRL